MEYDNLMQFLLHLFSGQRCHIHYVRYHYEIFLASDYI